MSYWPLEKNGDSFRINANLKNVCHYYMTPNMMYGVVLGKSFISIWNIKSRTLIVYYDTFILKTDRNILKSANGTSDSKYVFF